MDSINRQMFDDLNEVLDWHPALECDLEVIMRFSRLSKPTIALVQGYALAAGFELALACEMTVCEENARFGSSIIALLLPWYTNPKRAEIILLTAQDKSWSMRW